MGSCKWIDGGEEVTLLNFLIPPKQMEWMGRCEWMWDASRWGCMQVDRRRRVGGAEAG